MVSPLDPEEAQRERYLLLHCTVLYLLNYTPSQLIVYRGNSEYRAGNFAAAVKSYTRCLGIRSGNAVAFSNRAAAFLKLKEYSKAESDCSSALAIDPGHIKSLTRRAAARTAAGQHRAALADLLRANSLDPAAGAIRAELSKARELLRNAVARAPFVPVLCQADDQGVPCGPGLLA
jgi:tetratricopeptide (TPR) repeat protein